MFGFTRALHPQYRFALATALTAVARDVAAAPPGEMGRVLDRPTRFTTTGIFVSAARKDTLRAVVGIKDRQAGYLKCKLEGGSRSPMKRAFRLPGVVQTNEFGSLPAGLIRQPVARAQAGRRATSRRPGASV